MMRNPVPALCFVAMFLNVAKMSKSQKPEGLTPFGRKEASPIRATQMRIASPAKSSTRCVWKRFTSAQPATTVTATAIQGRSADMRFSDVWSWD